ncbi:MAG: adenylyl-sulfate kinase [Lachnospiraceae bacterium]|nr:adenylyl-sulfate kinase [Lachnospiraceae bacterium]
MPNIKKGTVYWITGLDGSGKTTIGNALYYKMKKTAPVVLFDGDILKEIAGGGVPGYTKEERLARAKRYSLLCKLLSDQGIDVIICTISMFDEVRTWNRENFAHYIEVFLDVSLDILKKRDKKGLYLNTDSKDELPGLHYEAEFPKEPDIVLHTDGSVSVKECVERIQNISCREKNEFNKDTSYWNTYYQQKPGILNECSSFAREMMNMINSSNTSDGARYLLDLGCGNGRDSVFFADNDLHVIGIDASNVAIEMLQQEHEANDFLEFICDDFVTADVLFQRKYDYCYSRFTLHAINEKQEEQLINNVYKALKKDGLFMIEVRTIHDTIYGKGELVEKNAYIYNEHYRRFIDPEEITKKVIQKGFSVVYSEEGSGFSKTETDDPVLLRLVLKK